MIDTDEQVFELATAAVQRIDLAYHRAPMADKLTLKPARDQAFDDYSRARLKLLEDDTLTTADDLLRMHELRAEVEHAADVQALVTAACRVAVFLRRFA